ncbi:MAG TPA: hypothetical protein VF300_04000 [Methanothrix sp.]
MQMSLNRRQDFVDANMDCISARSSGVPRVGLLASRAMVGGAAPGRGRPSDGG